jgi:hypothetical protein
MKKHLNKKSVDKKPSLTAHLTITEQIEINKGTIYEQISGSNISRLNNLNWIRHEIAYMEPHTLFYKPIKEQAGFFDYSCSKGLCKAYDYIIDKKNDEITSSGIRHIHFLICQETNILAGIYRKSNKILDISINGIRMHAPDEYMVPELVEKTIFDWQHSTKPDAMRAFDLHYNLVALQPFDDCNKRTARIIMNWALVLSGYHPIVFNRKGDKQNYCQAIKNMAMGDSKSYYKYMYECMKHSQLKVIDQLKRSKIR